MKRLFSAILILAFSVTACFAFASCGDKKGGGGSSSATTPENYDPRDPAQYIYRSVFANSPHKNAWETGAYGADLYGIWDQSVLPAGFPTEPAGVTKIDRTSYVGVTDQKLHTGGRQLGLLWVDDTDYQEYYVMFTGTRASFDDITAQLEQRFVCFDDRDDGWGSEDRITGYFYAFSSDWYLYMSYGEEREWDDASNGYVLTGEWGFTLYAIPKYHALPRVFQGVELPSFGYATSKAAAIQSYSDGDDDVEWLDYDYQTGRVTGTLGDMWASEELHYYGVTESVAEPYLADLAAAGFEMTSNGNNGEGQRYWRYKKGDLTVYIDLYTETSQMTISIEKGDIWYH